MKTIKGDKNMTNQNKTQETIKNLEADILEGGLTAEIVKIKFTAGNN